MATLDKAVNSENSDDTLFKKEAVHKVRPGASLKLPVEVYNKNSVLVLEFTETGGNDLPFSIAFNEKGGEETDGKVSKQYEQVSCNPASSRASFNAAKSVMNEKKFFVYGPTRHSFGLFVVCFESTGCAEFIWDNTESFFRGMSIKYTVEAYSSEADATAAVSTIRMEHRKVKKNFQLNATLIKEKDIVKKRLKSLQITAKKAKKENEAYSEKLAKLKVRATAINAEQSTLLAQIKIVENFIDTKSREISSAGRESNNKPQSQSKHMGLEKVGQVEILTNCSIDPKTKEITSFVKEDMNLTYMEQSSGEQLQIHEQDLASEKVGQMGILTKNSSENQNPETRGDVEDDSTATNVDRGSKAQLKGKEQKKALEKAEQLEILAQGSIEKTKAETPGAVEDDSIAANVDHSSKEELRNQKMTLEKVKQMERQTKPSIGAQKAEALGAAGESNNETKKKRKKKRKS